MVTDRNEDHAKYYNGYKIVNELLNKEDALNICELGCGPFTNLRLILPTLKKQIARIDLLDPLIIDYVNNVNHCSYKTSMLGFHRVNFINSAIESYDYKHKYDLVVMINVLEHCYDIDVIWDKIKSILKPNGIFIFADKFILEKNLNDFIDYQYDAGHALHISEQYIINKIDTDYETLYYNNFIDEEDMINQYYILKIK